ncbi:hypothetical protein ES705_25862 [subsurface metagenome]
MRFPECDRYQFGDTLAAVIVESGHVFIKSPIDVFYIELRLLYYPTRDLKERPYRV